MTKKPDRQGTYTDSGDEYADGYRHLGLEPEARLSYPGGDRPDVLFWYIPSKRKGIGGAKPKTGWRAVYFEIIRMANTPDGLPARPEMLKHLNEWADPYDKDLPGDSQLGEALRDLYESLGLE
jgi:hypothetical protein